MAEKEILLVEDDEDNAILAQKILSYYGFRTTLVRKGQEGIAACKARRPDLVLMDISLPDMDGLQATREIRALPDCAMLPILAVTAYDMEDEAIGAGCTGFVGKPFNPDELVMAINDHLQEER